MQPNCHPSIWQKNTDFYTFEEVYIFFIHIDCLLRFVSNGAHSFNCSIVADHLDGLEVKASTFAESFVFEPCPSHTSDLQIGILVATLPDGKVFWGHRWDQLM